MVWPQLICFFVLLAAIIVWFTLSIKKNVKPQGLMQSDEEVLWRCGCCYVNEDVRLFVLCNA